MADFQAKWGEFQRENIGLIAASVDGRQKAAKTAQKVGAEYPFGFGLDAIQVSRATGAFFEPEKKFLHATGFLLRPSGAIEVACYSTGNIGRLQADHVLALVKFLRKR